MAELILHRVYKGKKYTIGKLYRVRNNVETYICDILEDPVRNKINCALHRFIKVFGDTAIPYGRYQIVRNKSTKFNKILPQLLNVPHYEGIRIHSGNTSADTEGCLLPGYNKVVGQVVDSRKAFAQLDAWIAEKLKKEQVFITIAD